MHFSLLVILDSTNENSIDYILEPFMLYDGYPTEYDEFKDCTNEVLSSYNSTMKVEIDGETKTVLACNYFEDIIDFMDYEFGYEEYKEGVYGYYYNPNGIMDWYEIGGRYDGGFPININALPIEVQQKFDNIQELSNEYTNIVKKKYLGDFFAQEIYEKHEKIWDIKFGNYTPENEIEELEYSTFYDQKTLLNYFKDKDSFAKYHSAAATYAVLDKDGVIHVNDPDTLEWTLNYYDNFIKNLDDEDVLAIIDCHY